MILKWSDNALLANSIFIIYGSPNMLKAIQSFLQDELKISRDRIKFGVYWFWFCKIIRKLMLIMDDLKALMIYLAINDDYSITKA